MTTLAISPLPQLLERESNASSTESWAVHNQIQDAKRHVRAVASSMQSLAYPTLEDVMVQCSQHDWDGYNAKPISQVVYERVRSFLDALPMSLPAPDIVPEADGEIAVEWDLGANRIFSVSIGEGNGLHFAGLFGSGVERHGVEPFDGLVSQEILGYINRLYYPNRRAA